MKSYFISDVHLYPSWKPHPGREPLKGFLDSLTNVSAGQLWILGDLFDYWFEYRSTMPAGFSDVLCRLKNLSEAGWGIRFIPGNHDWWCGKLLHAETGMTIIRKTIHSEKIDGKKTVLAHGDGLGKGDTRYRMMKPVLRSRSASFLFSLLHPTIATELALLFSRTSKRLLHEQTDSIPEYLQQWAKHQAAGGAELVITGHTHCPSVVQYDNLTHVSLGDWISHFTYLVVGEGETSLHEYRN